MLALVHIEVPQVSARSSSRGTVRRSPVMRSSDLWSVVDATVCDAVAGVSGPRLAGRQAPPRESSVPEARSGRWCGDGGDPAGGSCRPGGARGPQRCEARGAVESDLPRPRRGFTRAMRLHRATSSADAPTAAGQYRGWVLHPRRGAQAAEQPVNRTASLMTGREFHPTEVASQARAHRRHKPRAPKERLLSPEVGDLPQPASAITRNAILPSAIVPFRTFPLVLSGRPLGQRVAGWPTGTNDH